MATKKFYEKKSWTYAMCAAFLGVIIILALFVVAPAIAPAGTPFGDYDGDGSPNWLDLDDDGDGVPDATDPAPYDPAIGDDGDDDDDDDDDDTPYWLTIEVFVNGWTPDPDPNVGNPFLLRSSVSGVDAYWSTAMVEPVFDGPNPENPWYWDLYIYKLVDGGQIANPEDFDADDWLFWDFDLGIWVNPDEGEFSIVRPPSASCVLGTSELGKAMMVGDGDPWYGEGETTATGIAVSVTITPGVSAYIYADSQIFDGGGSVFAWHILEINW